jgi:hypothetical protein
MFLEDLISDKNKLQYNMWKQTHVNLYKLQYTIIDRVEMLPCTVDHS